MDQPRPRPAQCRCTAAACGAGGDDIVDKDDRPPGDARHGMFRNRKGAAHIGLTLTTAQPAAGPRLTRANQRIEQRKSRAVTAKRAGKQCCLIIAPPPQPPPPQRHRHQQGAVIVQPVAARHAHVPGHQPRAMFAAAIFEAHQQPPRQFVIDHGGTRGIERRRAGDAGAAQAPVPCVQFERNAAGRTTRCTDEGQPRPAIMTQRIVRQHDHPTGKAAGWQCQCQQPAAHCGSGGYRLSANHHRAIAGKMDAAEPFDRRLRRTRRDRAAAGFAEHGFLRDHMIEELLARLGTVNRQFGRMLDLGCANGTLAGQIDAPFIVSTDAGATFARRPLGVQCDEDRLPFADGSFDLVMSAGVLHAVNDLPGALTMIRRALRPDGLFLAAFIGGNSLMRTRQALLQGDVAATGGAAARVAPMVDVQAAGDLLRRTGFALPVVDSETLKIRYASLPALLEDIRGAGEAHVLKVRAPLSRMALAAAAVQFERLADADGRIAEEVEIIYMTGWSPSPDQPQPLRRGSPRVSLATALGRKDEGDSGPERR